MSWYQSRSDFFEVEPSACGKCCKYTWKSITCLFSHASLITLVVAYCAAGAFTFEALEVHNEKLVKRSIQGIRQNVTDHLWLFTLDSKVLDENEFLRNTSILIRHFEAALVKSMTKYGWDGEEDEKIVQWTRTGSLFYSIIVITTIGYGHITPKTPLGKVITIFYAILGIPLMLICLSNIGDIMATSFRFIYWRVCCYVCSRPRQTRRSRSIRSSRISERFSRSRTASFRRSMKDSTRSADSGFGFLDHQFSLSDNDLRYHDYAARKSSNTSAGNQFHQSNVFSVSSERKGPSNSIYSNRGGSLDRKKKFFHHSTLKMQKQYGSQTIDNTPIIPNKYVLKETDLKSNGISGAASQRMMIKDNSSLKETKIPNYTQLLSVGDCNLSSEYINHSRGGIRKKKSSVRMNPSPKMMTPLGYGYKSKYLDDSDSDEDWYDDIYLDVEKRKTRSVPIGLCVFLVMSYIIAGAFLFDYWEQWGLLNAAYFCFITLTTIGFGDLVPAKGVSQITNETTTSVTVSIALCSLYLLFGIALLAMSFNLVQEEVINNLKSLATTLGIIKTDDDDISDDEEI